MENNSYSSEEPITEAEAAAFVGKRSEYYLARWKDGLNPPGRPSGLNFAAFLFTIFWFGYRRMYRVAAIFFAVMLTETVAEELLFTYVFKQPVPGLLSRSVGFAAAGVSGVLGNYWYLLHMRRAASEVKRGTVDPNERLRLLQEKGGTSWLAALLVPAAYLLLQVAVLVMLTQTGILPSSE